jgi:hypothetical protein
MAKQKNRQRNAEEARERNPLRDAQKRGVDRPQKLEDARNLARCRSGFFGVQAKRSSGKTG